ncbi:MAG TPA: hypothetical protein VKG25_05430 [Bryobacteraceae bacterium]|nr:hypothetical protein [Bryobacteraceae bacterium]
MRHYRTATILFAITAVYAADPALWSNMKYRMVGPERGGRVTAITGVPSQPLTFYMGSTGGGVWKTTDAGVNWVNVSDGQIAVGSMGAIEVSQSNPDIVYAGTGSSKIRSNVSIGRGLYKSTDAGKTWKFIGLRDVGQISAIRVNPGNPDMVFVAAQGNPFVSNKERGVYRSTDGGANWKQVLTISDSAGAADLQLAPNNPNIVYVCLWHGQRKPWTIISGAMEGGIYRSSDGGDTWHKLGGGLPTGLFGRSSVAISASKPERIYALVEAKPGSGLYRSEDDGKTWTLINAARNLTTRPFYYSTLGVDPNNSDIVYVGNEGWFKSTDGGKTFKRAPVPHGDNHEVWINPRNSDYMIQSNDGGANVSIDGGKIWSTQYNQPTAEIYQVALDNQYPYRIYGAQQDNTTVIVPSLPLSSGQEFRIGPGCETGPIIPDPVRPEIVYGGCKGQFSQQNMTTSNEERYWIGAESLYGNGGATLIYRFQRVSPMEVSPHPPHAVYYGSQFVHRSVDGGVHWQKISPDLTAHPEGTQEASGEPITRDATGEEVYSTLYAIRESPVQKGVIWTGSNDGLVFVTRDDGKTWANVTPKDLAPGGRVQNIEASPRRAGTAYVAMYRYLLGDFSPYLYRTDDFGKTWTRIVDGIAADEPTRVLREDPDRAGLLYAGTEFGMYVSFDNGAKWQPFQMNLPATPVTDIKIAHKDLVLSTQGRSFWILDNLTPLEQSADIGKPVLFAPREAIRTPQRGGGLGPRTGVQYPRPGAMLDYYLPDAPAGDIKVEVFDAAGKPVRTFTSAAAENEERPEAGGDDDEENPFRVRSGPTRLEKTAGFHRFTWDLRYPGPWISARRPEGPDGPVAVPGKYSVRLTVGSMVETQSLTVIEDPRITKDGVTTADLREQFEHDLRVRDLVSECNKLVARVKAAKDEPRLKDVTAQLITPPIRYSQPALQTHITYLYSVTNATDQKIGQDVVERYAQLREQLEELTARVNAVLTK